jgi:hypothetical protein
MLGLVASLAFGELPAAASAIAKSAGLRAASPDSFPSAACSSYTGNAEFVCWVYEDLLGRTPDAPGLNYWLSELSAGTTRTQVAYSVITSTESLTDYIEGDYEAFLGRAADAGGLSMWLQAFESGQTAEQIDAGILGSAEFYYKSGSTNSGFISALYEQLLSRSPDSAGESTWNAVLSNGVSRSQVANDIDTSPEEWTDDVQFNYQDFLGRAADQAGLVGWVHALETGTTQQQVIAAMLGSQEFFNDATAS